jgi:hypothetical protein
MLKWRFYYGDESTFSNEDGSPEEAPGSDVQIIIQEDPENGRYFQSGSDYYVWRDDRWWGVDIFGLFDFLVDNSLVKFGRTIDTKLHRKLHMKAEEDPDFPPRSRFQSGERRL